MWLLGMKLLWFGLSLVENGDVTNFGAEVSFVTVKLDWELTSGARIVLNCLFVKLFRYTGRTSRWKWTHPNMWPGSGDEGSARDAHFVVMLHKLLAAAVIIVWWFVYHIHIRMWKWGRIICKRTSMTSCSCWCAWRVVMIICRTYNCTYRLYHL